MSSTVPPAPEADIDARVLADQARTLQANVLWMMLGFSLCTLVQAWMLKDEAPRNELFLWLLMLTLVTAFNVWAGLRTRARPATPDNAGRRLRAGTQVSWAFGVLWGAGVLFLWPEKRFDLQVFVLFLTTGLISAGLLSMASHLPAFYGFMVPSIGALLLVTLWHGGLVNDIVATLVMAYAVAGHRFVGTMHAALVGAARARHEVDDLAARLQLQKDKAEEASRTKSRFLAAASHEMRQPVHSLSLFVGALSQQPQSAEGARLLQHMQTTVGAMGGMFNSLLDMSKLDASMVTPEIAPFDLLPVLQRVCADERGAAQDKGLSLHLYARALMVVTDAVLLERILRNLIVNAVRYTEQGSVSVSARLSSGQVHVKVQDTGVGIPPDRFDEVFHEFVQLQTPESGQTSGLGLGLAIVRRLTNLLCLDLQLQSTVGQGTVFTLRLPAASTDYTNSEIPPLPDPIQRATMAAKGHAVVVVDDDPFVRDAMQALLTAWGCKVITAAGLEEVQQLLPSMSMPRAIVSDYRLGGGKNGLDIIEYLRATYRREIPAILITGDTAPERLREAHDSGILLLHKPTQADALHAALQSVMKG